MMNNQLRIKKRLNFKISLIGIAFLIPAAALMCYAIYIPFVWNFLLSFQEWDGFRSQKWIGFSNYAHAFKDDLFITSLINSTYFALLSTAGAILLGILLALLLYKLTGKEGALYRFVIFMPVMLPTAIVGLLFTFIYNPEMGMLNNLLKLLGRDNWTHVWLEEKSLVMVCIAVVAIWKTCGTTMILCFAAMQMLPVSIMESSKLEGAGYIRQIFSIILPLIRPIILLASISTLGGQFKTYDLIFVMTRGGPGTATYTVPIDMTNTAFTFGEFGYAATMGVILTAVVILCIYLANKFIGGEHYEY